MLGPGGAAIVVHPAQFDAVVGRHAVAGQEGAEHGKVIGVDEPDHRSALIGIDSSGDRPVCGVMAGLTYSKPNVSSRNR